MADIEFPEGEFYACNDPETLTCTQPEEAIEAYLDGWASRDCDMTALIRENAPLTVTAYSPTEISDAQIDAWADGLLERLGEAWGDEHADPDSDPCDAFPDHAEATMRVAVREIIRGSRVWSCEVVGKVTLDAAQVEQLMRKWCPEWFEPAGAKSEGGGHA